MSEPATTLIADDDLGRVVPVGHAPARPRPRPPSPGPPPPAPLDAGDAMERTVVLAAALNGVLLLDRLARVDADALRRPPASAADARRRAAARLGRRSPTTLPPAAARIDALAASGPLAPPLPATEDDL